MRTKRDSVSNKSNLLFNKIHGGWVRVGVMVGAGAGAGRAEIKHNKWESGFVVGGFEPKSS